MSCHLGASQCGLLFGILCLTIPLWSRRLVPRLEDIPDNGVNAELIVLRKLAPGPGAWTSIDDLANLNRFGIGEGFIIIKATAKAAELRFLDDLGCGTIAAQAE